MRGRGPWRRNLAESPHAVTRADFAARGAARGAALQRALSRPHPRCRLRGRACPARAPRACGLAPAGPQDRLHQSHALAALRRARADVGHDLRPHADHGRGQPRSRAAAGSGEPPHRAGSLLQAAQVPGARPAARVHRMDGARDRDRSVPSPALEGHDGRLHGRQRPAWAPHRRRSAAAAAGRRGTAARARSRALQGEPAHRPRGRRQRPRQPARCPRPSGRALERAPARRGRDRDHRRAHRRAPGRARRTLEHSLLGNRAAGHGAGIRLRPLEGFTVVALEQVIAGPFATRQLAELGARVIKIERPGGGDPARAYDTTVKGLSSHFVWVNRSKESLTLDVKHPAARAILGKLVEKADVFLQNLAPGAADRLGLGSALRKQYPKLIWCGISGYGPSGPYATKKAYDLLVQCEAGLLSVTGTPEAPSKAGIPVADIAAGMYAFSGILAALFKRQRTGEGATLDITMFEALGEWMGFPAYFTAYGGTPPPRSGAFHATIVPYGPFKAGDGGTGFLGVQNERGVARFCSVVLKEEALVGDARFASGPARVRNKEAMHRQIDAVFSKLQTAEVIARLELADIANARLNDMNGFAAHPQLAARGRWAKVGSPAGEIDALKPPFNMDGMQPRMDPVPAVGEHTRAILAELGFGPAEVDRLAAAG